MFLGGNADPLQQGTLAWRIPWTEESGRLQYLGSQESDMTGQLNNNRAPSTAVLAAPKDSSHQGWPARASSEATSIQPSIHLSLHPPSQSASNPSVCPFILFALQKYVVWMFISTLSHAVSSFVVCVWVAWRGQKHGIWFSLWFR